MRSKLLDIGDKVATYAAVGWISLACALGVIVASPILLMGLVVGFFTKD